MNAGYRRQVERGLSLMVETESSKRGGLQQLHNTEERSSECVQARANLKG